LLFYSRFSVADGRALDSLASDWVNGDKVEVLPVVSSRAWDNRDTVVLARIIARGQEHLSSNNNSADALKWQYVVGLARAYTALVRRDSATAEREFRAIPDTLAWEATTIGAVIDAARVHSARMHAAEALALLARHPPSRLGVSGWQTVWHLEVARAAAGTGDAARAKSNLAYVSAAWSHADSALVRQLKEYQAEVRRHGVQ
jgi:hypothetical protein